MRCGERTDTIEGHRRVRAASAARRRPRRGVSLLEAVAALAIVGATGVAVLSATGAGVRTGARAVRAHEAEALGLELLTTISLVDQGTLRLLPDSLRDGQFAPPFDDYRWHTTVTSSDQWPGVYEVAIAVEWDGGAQTLSSTLYRRPTDSTAMVAP